MRRGLRVVVRVRTLLRTADGRTLLVVEMYVLDLWGQETGRVRVTVRVLCVGRNFFV